MQFKQPPVQKNEEGSLRTVGFELEFANVDIQESTALIQELFGGEIEVEHRFSQEVVNTRIGDFKVKIDLKLLNEKSYKRHLEKLNINLQDVQLGEKNLEYELESAMEGLIRKVIPYEITTPPLPVTELAEFEKLRKALLEHHAEGTEAFLTNAFATHINPETPKTDTGTILCYLRAFFLLYPWLFEKGQINIARRVTSFINPFPADYIHKILDPNYRPELETLIEDYHIHNPDRNRPLDMYPLFAALRPEMVESYQDIGNVKSRKTFHYRLPNSLISKPEWSLAWEWNQWIHIEELASDPEKVEHLSRDYLALRDKTIIGFDNKWIKQTDLWLS